MCSDLLIWHGFHLVGADAQQFVKTIDRCFGVVDRDADVFETGHWNGIVGRNAYGELETGCPLADERVPLPASDQFLALNCCNTREPGAGPGCTSRRHDG